MTPWAAFIRQLWINGFHAVTAYRQNQEHLDLLVTARACDRMRTLDHPSFICGNPHERTDPTSSDCSDSFVHVAVLLEISIHQPDQKYHTPVDATVNAVPSMLPCSVSTATQSKPHRATVRLWLVPGSICHAPKEMLEPALNAFCNLLAACIFTEALCIAPDCDIGGSATGLCLIGELIIL